MPTNSHTHCQVAQADTQAKTWQRVCLSKRTTDRQTDEEKEALGGNSVYVAIAGEVVNRRSVLLRNFVLNGKVSASNPLLHIHAKRCGLL
jgi:hypothetical protein